MSFSKAKHRACTGSVPAVKFTPEPCLVLPEAVGPSSLADLQLCRAVPYPPAMRGCLNTNLKFIAIKHYLKFSFSSALVTSRTSSGHRRRVAKRTAQIYTSAMHRGQVHQDACSPRSARTRALETPPGEPGIRVPQKLPGDSVE